MNAQRRKQLVEIHEQIDDMRYQVECMRDEEKEELKSMPGSFQKSPQGARMRDSIRALGDLYGVLDDADGTASSCY